MCIHNSARSQMAETFVNTFSKNSFIAESAGIEPGKLNHLVVEAMKEIGIDISKNKTKSIQDMIKQNKTFDYLVTVCDEASAEKCPVFPGQGKRIHFSFPDPSAFTGTREEKLVRVRVVRDEIKKHVEEWLKTISKG